MRSFQFLAAVGLIGWSNLGSAWAFRAPETEQEAEGQSARGERSAGRRILQQADQAVVIPNGLHRDMRDLVRLPVNLAGMPRTEDAVVQALRKHLRAHSNWLGGVRESQLRLRHVATVPATNHRPAMIYVDFMQQHEGRDVEGSSAHFSVKPLANRSVIVSAEAQLYPSLTLGSGVRRAQGAMRAQAAHALGLDPANATFKEEHRVIRYLDGRWRRVTEVRFSESDLKGVVDEDAGTDWVQDDRLFTEEIQGTVQGRGVLFDPITTGEHLTTFPLKDLKVTAASGATSYTDAAGLFIFPTEKAPTTVNAMLQGRWASVQSLTGSPLNFSGLATPGVPFEILFNPTGAEEFATAQVNGYHHTTFIHDWVKARLSGPLPGIDVPIQVIVNRDGTCNAFFSPVSISFYKSGRGCINAAYDTVIYHEYGHVVDLAAGGITSRGLSEGWGDLLASYATTQPLIGEGFFGPGRIIRTADNTYQYPPSPPYPPGGLAGAHDLGQAWAGFAWHLRQNLITLLGEAKGVALAESLVIPVFLANSPDIPSAVLQVLLLDDDDGNLANGTPHEQEIRAAAAQHRIPIPEPESIPPAPVSDLTAQAAGLDRIILTWTATGDDGLVGTAETYDIRYALSPIASETEFDRAIQVEAEPRPKPSGSAEQMTVVYLVPGTTYHVAMKVLDNMGNASVLSNLASATSELGDIVYSEDFESGAPGWTSTGLWHLSQARASSPTTSWAYNDGVDYDTGFANSGFLEAPSIALPASSQILLVFRHWYQTENTPAPIGFDGRVVQVSSDGGMRWSTVRHWNSIDPNQLFWAPTSIDLSAFAGKTILIIFPFGTGDAAANNFEGWYVDDVQVFTTAKLNHSPILIPIGDQTVKEGQIRTVTLSASDADGDALTFLAWNLPPGATFNPATATFSWTPSATQAGVYPNVHFEVSDGKLTDAEDITITVQEAILGLGGRITTAQGNPVTNIKVQLRQGKTLLGAGTTDATGRYQFTGLTPAQYRVHPKPTRHWTFNPANRRITLGSQDQLSVDFTAVPR